jgi:hypothetical protein
MADSAAVKFDDSADWADGPVVDAEAPGCCELAEMFVFVTCPACPDCPDIWGVAN